MFSHKVSKFQGFRVSKSLQVTGEIYGNFETLKL